MKRTHGYSAAAVAAVLCAGLATIAYAQAPKPRMWNWYGEMVSVDQAAKTITVKAQIAPPVANYLKEYKAGDRVVLIWNVQGAQGGDADAVLAVATPDEMKVVDVGYITRVDFVAADAAAKTLTFKTVVPDAVLASIASVQPGSWIKVTAPMEQPGTGFTLTAAVPSTKPAPRPPKPAEPAAPATTGGRGGAPDAASAGAVKANGGISGNWSLTMSLGGNTLASTCELAQDGPKLGGTCSAMGGDKSVVAGTVDGTKVNFTFSASLAGNTLDLAHSGTVDATGTKMTGSVTVFGMEAEFTGTKK
jgi:hypothetical protein